MDLITLVGMIGASLVLAGFVGNRLKYWQSDSRSYVAINAVGSLVLVGYSIVIESYPFVALNVVWLLFSVNDLFRKRR
jgi:fucose permease